MNVRKLRALVTAVELGSFSRAAEQLGYTQSGLTHMMNSLEEELGLPLIRRGSFGVRLTEEGARLLPEIRRLVELGEALSEKAARLRRGEGTPLRVGALPSLAATLLPGVVRLFGEAYPASSVTITEGDTEELCRVLSDGRLDLVLADRREGIALPFHPLFCERLLAAVAEGTEEGGPLPLDGRPLLLPVSEYGAALVSSLRGRDPHLNGRTVVSMVAEGLGVGLLPEGLLRGAPGVRGLVTEPPLFREVGIFSSGDCRPSEAVRRFIGEARRLTEGLAEEV